MKMRIWFKKSSHRSNRVETVEADYISVDIEGLSFFNVDSDGNTIYPAFRNISKDQVAEWRIL